MSTLAIIHPNDLLAVELRESLDRRRDLWRELRLLTTSSDEAGALTEVRGGATVVQELEEDSLVGVDVAFLCGPIAANRPLLSRLEPATQAIVMSTDAGPEDGHPVVAALNLETLTLTPLISPHPGTVALSHLLYPLMPFHPQSAFSTLLQPISMSGRLALDEVLEQTRSILRFEAQQPTEIFPTQLAFNLLPTDAPIAHLTGHLRTVLGADLSIAVQVLQAGVFHGFGISLYVQLRDDPGPEELRDALAEHLINEIVEEPELLGPIDAAAREKVLIGPIEPDPGQRGGYWLWAVMDNLTCGGALNALQILEAVRHQVAH